MVGTVTFLDIAYSHTINTLENDADMPCSSDMNRLFDDCMLIKGPETVMRHVGCTVPYVPNPYPTCDPNNQTLLGEVLRVYEVLYDVVPRTVMRSCRKGFDLFID